MQGRFAFSSDLHADGMLWGRTLRSPHPHARIVGLDVGPALAIAGVACVVTADDVPGAATYGLISADQPVFAHDVVRFVGEPVAAVAADHPDTARRALDAIVVDYEALPPLVDAEAAPTAPPIHPDGNVIRRITIEHGDCRPRRRATDVVVEGTYEVGMQDQAFLGPESGLAVPDGEGGVDLWVATQWLHEDRDQVAACLGLGHDDVRLHLGGVGGAFGAREDVSMQVHACLLALAAGRPVKMSYLRDESFLGHVHRHPARMRYRHHATRDGALVKVEAELVLDGGAYASSSSAVVANAARFACGPYRVPNACVDAAVVRTNNPPCGAMRGFGAVQVCFAHEAQMDKLAAALGIDPVELRLRNAMAPATCCPPASGSPARRRSPSASGPRSPTRCPRRRATGCSSGRAAPGAPPTRPAPGAGVGFAVGFKNLLYSEGFDDDSEARVRLAGGVATVTCAVAEVGQGFVTIAGQIARTVLGCDGVVVEPADTSTIGSAGSSSASRQTWMSGGAVLRACRLVADQVRADLARRLGVAAESLLLDDGGRIRVERGSRERGRRHGGRGRRRRDLRGDGRPPAPAHRAPRRPGAGRRRRELRVRRPPGRGRRRPRPRAGAGRAGRHGPGRRPGAAPDPGHRPDRGRHRPGRRAGGDGGDRGRRRPRPEPELHRLPHPHHRRHPRGAGDAASSSPSPARRSGPRAWASRRRSRRPPAVAAAIRAATGVDVTRVPVRPWDLVP